MERIFVEEEEEGKVVLVKTIRSEKGCWEMLLLRGVKWLARKGRLDACRKGWK